MGSGAGPRRFADGKAFGGISLARVIKHPLDILLIVIAILCLAVLFLAHEDPFARNVICARTGVCPTIENARAWNKIFYDLAAGALVSLVFYVLIVRLPDYQKRRRYKKSLAHQYKDFRHDSIALMLGVSDGSYDSTMPEQLSDQKKFRAYFQEQVTQDQDRWDRFCNNLDESHQKEIVKRMEIFRDEIAFILNNVDIPSDEPFEFLKRLSTAIYSIRDATLEYDDVKQFSRFLWEMFAGFSFVSGYRERDVIQEMIDSI
jgi:hypothetical protein